MRLFLQHFQFSLLTTAQTLICLITQIIITDAFIGVANDFIAEQDIGKVRMARSPRSRHMISRVEKLDTTECIQAYENVINHHCRYPGMQEPCYRDEEEQSDSDEQQSREPSITIKDKIQSTVRECCHGSCPLNKLEGLCCRSSDCLKRCYGSKLDVKPNSSEYFEVLSLPHRKST